MNRKLKLLQPVSSGDPSTGAPLQFAAGEVIDENQVPPGHVRHWESWGGVFEVVEEEPRDKSGRFAKKE